MNLRPGTVVMVATLALAGACTDGAGPAATATVATATFELSATTPQPTSTLPPTSQNEAQPCVDTPSSGQAPTDNPYALPLEAALADPAFANVEVSISVWADGLGEVLTVEPDAQLLPASNQKLFTAIGAMLLLDLDHRFETTIERHGDAGLVLRAGGDPTLNRESLNDLARQVAANGIDRVRTLTIDAGHFEQATSTAGRLDWQMPTYTGPLSAFTVDDNRWRTDDDFLADPALANGQRLAEALGAAGVEVGSVMRSDRGRGDDSDSQRHDLVASLLSPTVGELMSQMLLSSDNETAEALLREIGDGSTAAGIERIDTALERNCLVLSGRSGDGSGLSRDNVRSAREWNALLRFALRQPWGDALVEALPVAGRSGTLADRLTGPATAGTVRAKTGSIIGGRALTGVIPTRNQLVVFSIIVNGEPEAANASESAIDALVTAISTTAARSGTVPQGSSS